MRLVFIPAIAMMNRLRYPVKFALIGVISFIAIAVLLSQLVAKLNEAINLTESEQRGLRSALPLHKLIEVVQQHRGLSSGVINGDVSLKDRRDAKEKQVGEAIQRLEGTLFANLAKSPEWATFKTDWERLRADGLKLAAADNFAGHTAAIGHLLEFMSRVGDESALMIDPEYDTFYTADLVILRMPQTLEPLGQLRARGTGILAKKVITEQQRVDISTLMGEIKLGMRGILQGTARTVAHDPHQRDKLVPPAENFSKAYEEARKLVQEDILGAAFSTAPAEYFNKTTAVLDLGYKQLYEALIPMLEKELQERLDQLKRARLLSIAISLLVLLVVTYLAIGAYFSIIEGIGHLAEKVAAIAGGDLTVRVALDSRDELQQVGESFNRMAEEVATLIRGVQQSAGKLSDSAQRMAASSAGIGESSRHQSTAAASMAASVEQMTVGVGHISNNAQEALRAAGESGSLSITGGEKMRQVVSEIERLAGVVNQSATAIAELESHSGKISTIVNVIKEIADQTNLLALNAAIEAARAGEQGRGFAVVADEVRKLAERTSASTQEIASMVQAIQSGTRGAVASMQEGVKCVDAGVGEARQAGEAMNCLREQSRHVVSMVSDISAGLREQSTAANEVARGIEQVARMAERNDVAVRGSVDTAADVDRLAQKLQADILHFRV